MFSHYDASHLLTISACFDKAWRNQVRPPVPLSLSRPHVTLLQPRAPTNARSCKHLKTLLGDEYEDARVQWKDPEGFAARSKGKTPAKGKDAAKSKPASTSKTKPASPSKAKPVSTSKAKSASPSKAKPVSPFKGNPASGSKGKPASKDAGLKRKKQDDEDEEDGEEDTRAGKRRKAVEAGEEGEVDDEQDAKCKFQVMLANKWDVDSGADPTGWWISEKLDGVRYAYASFLAPLPAEHGT
jgi:DNA ligase-1